MAPKNLRDTATPDNPTLLRTLLAPTIQVVHENYPPLCNDLDLRQLGLSADLARRVCLAAGGTPVGKRILVATKDLCAYLRANPSPAARKAAPRPAKHTATATMTAEQIALANGLRVVAGKGER